MSIINLSASKQFVRKAQQNVSFLPLVNEEGAGTRENRDDLQRSFHGERRTNSPDLRRLYPELTSFYERAEIERNLCPGADFMPQSGTTSDNTIMRVASESKHQNVEFGDQKDPYMYAVDDAVDPTRKLMDSDDARLDNFLSRPLKISETQWGTGTLFFQQIDPWSLYLQNPRVINRITNFNLLRAKLNLKIVINGNGFLYGRAIASYLPFAGFDNLSQNRGLVLQDIVQASQQPHVFLDPTLSLGGDMQLPFYYHKNYLDITQSDWGSMGQLTIRSINELKHANGATDSVTVTIFAWIDDASMNVLTSVEPTTLVPQSGAEVDEANMKGFISGPATAVQKAANALSSIPMIAPFATATATGAGVVAEVAKTLGYCRPPVTADPNPYKPVTISELAVTTVPDGTHKLTVDDKQELSIDPRIAGLGAADPMNIREIAKRESYLTTFNWTIGTAPETLLWNSRISPLLWAEDGLTPKGYHFPASAMAAFPFKYWTGSMKFRFQIVCSAFHKGRVKVVYDPNFLSSNEYNTNYLEVIDIADKNDFTIEIGNGQPTTLLEHAEPGLDAVTTLYGTSQFTSKTFGNGVIGMYVVNELTTPNSSVNNDIQINVFVSMGDDFEVFVPHDTFQNFVFKPQSGFEEQSGMENSPECQNTEEPSAPQQSESSNVGPGITNHGLINKVYTGEAIVSFRALLKRYNLHSNLVYFDTTNKIISYGRRPMFPFLRGNVAGAVNTTGAAAPYNYCNTVLLHWVTYAFSGWRGSIRWKAILRGYQSEARAFAVNIERVPIGEPGYRTGRIAMPSYTNFDQAAQSVVVDNNIFPRTDGPLSGVRGKLYVTGQINPNIEFESPFYSLYRFSPGKAEDLTTTLDYQEGYDFSVMGSGTNDTAYDAHCAIGEDFQVYFFTGLPPMYYEASAPAA
ncbi:hypothetical protein 2 [Beihai picorna-like virus 21]|uniref:hypothetical protein 2 n=1 Tax=Beihai picorna-like virus 21 TaxID=1922564 RepID=UPI00090B248E|nr:hypothetical protein 2 [Beihai picorna-like virus 21]APG78949.1 hypothetical protein 2 [Beihai picorna-like virus 21]